LELEILLTLVDQVARFVINLVVREQVWLLDFFAVEYLLVTCLEQLFRVLAHAFVVLACRARSKVPIVAVATAAPIAEVSTTRVSRAKSAEQFSSAKCNQCKENRDNTDNDPFDVRACGIIFTELCLAKTADFVANSTEAL
jgi:hypothetical protein